MELIKVASLKEGMVVSKTIFRVDGSVVLGKGTELKETFIQKLEKLGISEIYIESNDTESIEPKDLVFEETRNQVNKAMYGAMANLALSDDMDLALLRNLMDDIIDDLSDQDKLLERFMDVKAADDYTSVHCINVAIWSIVIGMSLNYKREQLKVLGMGALLHDVGKARVDQNILNKPTKLTKEEFEDMKKHTIKGYEILKRIPKLEPEIANIALFHHERVDGTGYPFETRGDAIPELAKIVSVADVFDALTSDRVYRKKMETYMVADYLHSMKGIQFEEDVVNAFCSNLALYPSGKRVKLTDGRKGYVVISDRRDLAKPLVLVTHGRNLRRKASPYLLRLIDYEDIYIEDVY